VPVSFNHRGSFDNLESFLKKMQNADISYLLHRYAKDGVAALSGATPIDSAETASMWGYTIEQFGTLIRITWTNDNINQGFPIAIMLQYGYGTGTGGYVYGRDYINPAIRPIFDRIADEVWKVVTSA
jgi:subtilase family serine protease